LCSAKTPNLARWMLSSLIMTRRRVMSQHLMKFKQWKHWGLLSIVVDEDFSGGVLLPHSIYERDPLYHILEEV
jgi:hypothetical protein